jgi:hypothetical protein
MGGLGPTKSGRQNTRVHDNTVVSYSWCVFTFGIIEINWLTNGIHCGDCKRQWFRTQVYKLYWNTSKR